MENKLINLTGKKFGIWNVLGQAPRRDNKTRWLCKCRICGQERSLRSTSLRACKYDECNGKHSMRTPVPSPLKKPPGFAAETETLARYKAAAKSRGLEFSLTREEFHRISQLPCHYCGAPPGQKAGRRHFNGPFIYSGIDRKDSSVGYHQENCLPCCGTCNVMKQDLSYTDFLGQITRIFGLHGHVDRETSKRISLGASRDRPSNFEKEIP